MADPGEPSTARHLSWCAPGCPGALHRSRPLGHDGLTLALILCGPHVAVEVVDASGRRVLDLLDAAVEFGPGVRVLVAETLRGAT